MPHRAYIGIGANLGGRIANIERALEAIEELGETLSRSSLYRTKPWGKTDQPWFVNMVVLLETDLAPRALLARLQAMEKDLGRTGGERWGPRTIDLDLLLYDDLAIDEPGLRVPHPHLHERAFVLVPLAEIDDRFEALRDTLHESERAGVSRVERESVTAMPDGRIAASERVRALAEFLIGSDAVRVRIVRAEDDVEIALRTLTAGRDRASAEPAASAASLQRIDTIKADLVGIFHLGRPVPLEGELVDGDRELGHIEALGIRTPVSSMGEGRLVSIAAADGAPVEYGQPLFLLARTR
jgi:2-amino-4-hydroxy-6-hydroxymethyldihydropteridine diphosphokinase